MLFLLTGNIQTGKTRWLEKLVDELASEGVLSYGALAPGRWIESDGQRADAHGLEKIGIDNRLLPGRTVIPFARRRDLALQIGDFDPKSQSAQANMGWAISDAAIRKVNDHFSFLRANPPDAPSFLVVDELGRLELKLGAGLNAAMLLLESGQTSAFPHALAVVREDLLPLAQGRFSKSWSSISVIYPTESSTQTILDAFREQKHFA